uniref:DNA-binding protein SMUBP-2 n=1 Tax=Vitis vinifera TaxID=29760 RepID=A5BIS8_VITVI|nr:hypothetical protein VITISV_022848 [Vitis vinifera]
MEAALSCYFTLHFRSSSIACNSPFPKTPFFIRGSSNSGIKTSNGTRRRSRSSKKPTLLKNVKTNHVDSSDLTAAPPVGGQEEGGPEEKPKNKPVSVRTLYQNGDPLGRRELRRCVVRWISQGMRGMALDFASAELQGEFAELRQRMGPGLSFVIQAQPYLNAIPMPLGHEAICLKACTHYPTLFDHFQRELRDVLQDHQRKSQFQDWRETQSWQLLKELANSGMELDKAKAIQSRIDEFTKRMSELLQIERDSELEFTQEELNAVPTPDESSDSSKPIEFLVSHGQAQQELCDTICNLNAVSTFIGDLIDFVLQSYCNNRVHFLVNDLMFTRAVFTGLGGMHLVLFKVEGNHRLPPTTLSPGDMVCVRICDSRGAGATSCMQGFVDSLGKDGCSISVALESRHGDPTFSKLFGKSVRIDRIHGLADALTYEISTFSGLLPYKRQKYRITSSLFRGMDMLRQRNCEALMLLQKNGLQKKNPSIAVVATLFGDKEDVAWLEENDLVDWAEVGLDELLESGAYDDSQRRAIALGLNKKRPILIIQGPPGTGKTVLLKELIALAVQQGERVLVTAPTNAAVDNMVEKLSNIGVNIVRVGNPARISSAVASKSLGEIVNSKLENFLTEFERKKSDLRKDLRHCLKDDSLAAGIRQLLKQLGKALKKKEKETVKEVLSSAQVVLATNTGAADPVIRRLDAFDLVIIDEAGQAIEPSCWIPILQGKRCIIAGDQCQLAPVILSRKALEGGLGVSLLERAATLHEEVLATKLTTQYRMNDAIASWASKEMYGGSLKSSSSVFSHLLVDSPFVKV